MDNYDCSGCQRLLKRIDRQYQYLIQRAKEAKLYRGQIERLDAELSSLKESYDQLHIDYINRGAELKAKDELLQKSATYLRRQSNIGKKQMDFIKQIEQALKGEDDGENKTAITERPEKRNNTIKKPD